MKTIAFTAAVIRRTLVVAIVIAVGASQSYAQATKTAPDTTKKAAPATKTAAPVTKTAAPTTPTTQTKTATPPTTQTKTPVTQTKTATPPATQTKAVTPPAAQTKTPTTTGTQSKTATPPPPTQTKAAPPAGQTKTPTDTKVAPPQTKTPPAAGNQPRAGGAQPNTTPQRGRGATALNVVTSDTSAAAPLILMREVFEYDRDGRRDPFMSLLQTTDLRPTLSDLKLLMTVVDEPGRSVALVADAYEKIQKTVRVGTRLGRMRVSSIRENVVVFTIEEFGTNRRDSLQLRDLTKVRGR
jgi:hypothetical protein